MRDQLTPGDAARGIMDSLLYLANVAQRAGLSGVTRRLSSTIEDLADWADTHGQQRYSPLPAPPPL